MDNDTVTDEEYLAAIERLRKAKLDRDSVLALLREADAAEEAAYNALDDIRNRIVAEVRGKNDAA